MHVPEQKIRKMKRRIYFNYPYAGRNGLHEECNGNGYKLVQFAAATDMIIGELYLPIRTQKSDMEVTGWRHYEPN
jgi:hypothetical protein